MTKFCDVVKIVKSNIEAELSPTAYSLWIDPLKAVELRDSEVILSLNSEFQKNIIVNKYSERLCEGFKDILGFEVKLTIVVEETDSRLLNIKKTVNNNEKKETEKDKAPEIKKIENIKNINNVNTKENYPYTFKTFIVGSTNTFAYAACKAVAQNQTGAYNPLFIYGPSGMGKTHLLLAIKHEVSTTKPSLNVVYINGESFTNEFISAIAQETTREFHEKYRNVDYLLMDDIQFLAGKRQTQEEFFYTFNDLHQIGKQIVLTSDRPPKEIKTLEDRLRTRFEWGLLADIAPSDFETRVAIIKRKAEMLNVTIPQEIINYIAQNLKNNIRQLEGAVKKIKAFELLASCAPTMNMAHSIIKDILNDDQPTPVTISKIIGEVSKTFNVSEKDIKSAKRKSQIAKARHIAIYIVREITQAPYEEIGAEFSNRDHSTITHSIKKVEEMMQKDSRQKEIIEDIITNIRDS